MPPRSPHSHHDQPHHDWVQSDARERFAQFAEREQEAKNAPVNIQDANPADIQLAYSNGLYNLQAHTGEPTYVLFGGWQTEQELGFVAAVHAGGQTDARISTEDRDGRDIQTELHNPITHIIDHSQPTNRPTPPTQTAKTSPPPPTTRPRKTASPRSSGHPKCSRSTSRSTSKTTPFHSGSSSPKARRRQPLQLGQATH